MTDKASSRLPIILAVSVIVNALLIGFVLGGGLKARTGGERPPMVQQGGGDEFGLARSIEQSLQPAERRVVRRALRQAFLDTREERAALSSARQQLAELLAAENYDRGAVDSAFEQLRTSEANAKTRLHEELNNQLSTLSAEQRRNILKSMERRERFRRRGGRDERDRPPPR